MGAAHETVTASMVLATVHGREGRAVYYTRASDHDAGAGMIVGHGIDLIECARIEKILREHPDRFLTRILTDAERAYCDRHRAPVPRIAGRFAAKEAVLKVLGTGWRGRIAWTDIEILNDEAGRPHVTLSGECARIGDRLGIRHILISITHTEHYAAASAIGVTD